MDPSATLEEARKVASRLVEGIDNDRYDGAPAQLENDADKLASLFFSLDEWLSKGGFLPKAWERK